MKVLNLQCQHGHAFEGWFASEHAFQEQRALGQVQCPLCADAAIEKLPSAPRLNLSSARAPQADPAAAPVADAQPAHALAPAGSDALAAAWMAMARALLAQTQDVGERFAEEARKMHYGEKPEQAIRGRTSADEARALLDEGIAVFPVLLPDALKSPLH